MKAQNTSDLIGQETQLGHQIIEIAETLDENQGENKSN